MSGPYDCLRCGGDGFFGDEDSPATIKCTACDGTGERWLETVFCPSQEDRDLGRVEYVDGKWRFKPRMRPW